MDSEIVIFGAIGAIGGAVALVLAHFYALPEVAADARGPLFYELTQRETLPADPARR